MVRPVWGFGGLVVTPLAYSPPRVRARPSVRRTRTQSSCEKEYSQRSTESRGFLRVLWFPPT